MKIIVLDAYSINPGDLTWEPVEKLCDFTSYDRTRDDQMIDRLHDCDGFFVSKVSITREIMEACPKLKFIGVTATGYDNVDLEAAKDLGIAVYNVPAYSTEAVAQHAFALILELTNYAGSYNAAVQAGDWYRSEDFTFINESLTLLDGKSLGIIGYGNIGRRVARIAEAFGMKVNIYSQDPKAAQQSDYVTLHCPATAENKGFINKAFIAGMKDGAVLINTARGALIHEEDLAEALKSGKLAAAGLDVLTCEPPAEPHPLIGLKNCILTPHNAWMPRETRKKVIDICARNLQSFLDGEAVNRII